MSIIVRKIVFKKRIISYVKYRVVSIPKAKDACKTVIQEQMTAPFSKNKERNWYFILVVTVCSPQNASCQRIYLVQLEIRFEP